MYRSDNEASEPKGPSLHEKSLPAIASDPHPTKPRVTALIKREKLPLGLTIAAGILFLSGVAILGGMNTELFFIEQGIKESVRITNQGILSTQMSLVRPLGTPIARLVEAFESQK